MKKILSSFLLLLSVTTVVNAQITKVDSTSMMVNVEEVIVLSSYAKSILDKPIVLSTITSKDILNKLSNQEFPEILKYTPSIYATKMGGGFGDARVTLRGFGSENISTLINGVPVNG
ncbi:MAG: TonB-dependent receptor plug domain-containing protein, partial [Rikenellaceae bacterium]